jgi:predicted secreted protein with PEFG-CTERM motif
LIQIDAPDEGKIALKIPRNALDAKKSDIQDEKFIVLIDDIQVPYEEKENNSQIRFITINFEEGDSKIAIIGTFIVPEFGTVAGLILLSGIIITIGFSKNRLQLKY